MQQPDKNNNGARHIVNELNFIAMRKIILASQSPRRKQLLQWADIDFEVIVPDVDETIDEGLTVVAVAESIAATKAMAVAGQCTDEDIIISADTVVVCNGRIIGKPVNRQDAIDILQTLSANIHKVITGVCIRKGNEVQLFSDITEVHFNNLTDEQIIYYIDKYKPYDKAGAYAIQEWIGVVGIKKIDGDFYNVMGLPVSRVIQALKNL